MRRWWVNGKFFWNSTILVRFLDLDVMYDELQRRFKRVFSLLASRGRLI